jgi:hypothetical protein
MTTLLEKAIFRVSELPPRKQNAIARLLMEEMDAEVRWDKSFKSSQSELSQMAGAAIAEHVKGRTRALDFSNDF